MFSKNRNKPQNRIDTLVGADTHIMGDIQFTGGIRVDGSVRGNVTEKTDMPGTLILSEHANAFSSQSDLSLISLKGYRTITSAGGIETATSMHLYFDAALTAFRFMFRIDGAPIIKAPITPPAGKSTNSRSYFVTLGAR